MTKVNPDRDSLFEALSAGEVLVRFLKKNGEDRSMRCTRNLSAVPEDLQPKNPGYHVDPDFVPVYDLETEAWRGFKISRLISATKEGA